MRLVTKEENRPMIEQLVIRASNSTLDRWYGSVLYSDGFLGGHERGPARPLKIWARYDARQISKRLKIQYSI